MKALYPKIQRKKQLFCRSNKPGHIHSRENMEPQRFWDKIASKYDKQALGKYQETYQETISISKKYLKPTDNLLDFACGTGITTIEAAKSVQQVMAIDLSGEMIRVAREKATSSGIDNITFKIATIEDTELINNSFDVVTAFNILHGINNVDAVLTRIWSLLKPGGIFLSVTDCLGEKISIRILYTVLSKLGFIPNVTGFKRYDLLKMICTNGFRIIEDKNLYPSPPNYFIAARKIDE
jgi:ubiquinone/menaquinone biosynthesis C-methylase UbiE